MAFPYKWPAFAGAENFPKVSQKSTTPKKAAASLCLPLLLAEPPQAQNKQRPVSTSIATSIRWSHDWHKLWPVLVWNVAATKKPQTQYKWQPQKDSNQGTNDNWSQFVPWPLQMPPNLEEVVTNYRLFCSSHWLVPSQAQTMASLGLHWSPSQEAPESTYPVATFRSHKSITQPTPPMTHSKGRLSWH